jgi:hypothetical protein
LGPGGSYPGKARQGSYKVYIEPPIIVNEDTGTSPRGQEERHVDNIPPHYRNWVDSPWTATVAGEGGVHEHDQQR